MLFSYCWINLNQIVYVSSALFTVLYFVLYFRVCVNEREESVQAEYMHFMVSSWPIGPCIMLYHSLLYSFKPLFYQEVLGYEICFWGKPGWGTAVNENKIKSFDFEVIEACKFNFRHSYFYLEFRVGPLIVHAEALLSFQVVPRWKWITGKSQPADGFSPSW